MSRKNLRYLMESDAVLSLLEELGMIIVLKKVQTML